MDKLPMEGRVKWVEDNLGVILENANDPFKKSSLAGLPRRARGGGAGGGGGNSGGEAGGGGSAGGDSGSDLLQNMLVESKRNDALPVW